MAQPTMTCSKLTIETLDQGVKYVKSCVKLLWFLFFFFNWNSLHARLNSHYMRHGVKRKEAQKRLQDTENLFRKNLQLKDVC